MAGVPFLSRLPFRDYVALVMSLTFLILESIIRSLTLLLPVPVIQWFRYKSAKIWHKNLSKPKAKTFTSRLQECHNFTEMCAVFGYEAEEHVLQTKDGYLLGLHRICRKREEGHAPAGSRPRRKLPHKPVVYLHHGLLMNSEVWICAIEEKLSLPFRLVEEGYDVWFGNNRGNKYSKKCLNHLASKPEFWNFSMDEFAFYDIPNSIDYILDTTRASSLNYIGFSQGTAQAFAALSIHPQLNEKVDIFIALAPAMSPKGLRNPIVDAFIKASPIVLFLLFGRKALMTSTIMWQSIIYPPIFVRMIDISCNFLFGWTGQNIAFQQKIVSYAHLYSYTSVKTLVHWFQIIRAQTFQMYDDETSTTIFGNPGTFYKVAKFPTKNIYSPIILIYGGSDSLVDIDVMLAQLPPHTVAKKIENYEHLDLLWGQNVDKDVFPHVLEYLKAYSEPVESAKAEEAQQSKEEVPLSPPAYSKRELKGLRKRDLARLPEPGVSYAKAAGGDSNPSAERKPELSYAEVAAEPSSESHGSESSDSDQTIGEEENDHRVQPGLSFAEVAKVGVKETKNTEGPNKSEEAHGTAPGIDKHVTSEVSYADVAAK